MLADSVAHHVYEGAVPDPELLKQSAIRCEIIADVTEITAEDIKGFYNKKGEENEQNPNA